MHRAKALIVRDPVLHREGQTGSIVWTDGGSAYEVVFADDPDHRWTYDSNEIELVDVEHYERQEAKACDEARESWARDRPS